MVGKRVSIQVDALAWGEENTDHIANHDVYPEDVEHVFAHNPIYLRNMPDRTATHVMIGVDSSGRMLFVPILETDTIGLWRVVTAWESPEARKRYRRGRRRRT